MGDFHTIVNSRNATPADSCLVHGGSHQHVPDRMVHNVAKLRKYKKKF